jgi:bifunctional non-homologous end joining protein LigD
MAQRTRRTARRKAPAKTSGTVEVPHAGPRTALPDFIPPELATLVGKAPDGERWNHEMKFDGCRTAGHIAERG